MTLSLPTRWSPTRWSRITARRYPSTPELARRPGTTTQVAALLAVRVAAVRGPARRRATFGLALLPVLLVASVVAGTQLPHDAERVQNATLLMPSALLLFLLGSVLAATSGGGRALLPRDEALALPVGPAAEHLGAVLLAPLNLSWLVQSLGLLTLTAWISPAHGLPAALAVTVVWLAVATMLGQTVGWVVELVRTWAAGQWLVRTVQLGGLGYAVYLIATSQVLPTLDRAPTVPVVVALAAGAAGSYGYWATVLAELAGLGVLAWFGGVLAAGRVQRRPPRAQVLVEARDYPGRPQARSLLAASLRVDRAGVWRSAPLRRGLVALAAIPGLAAAAVRLDWPMVALLPGLVASGAGLLFGVNAFALDGTGAVWRETLPGPPRVQLTARALTVAEVCLVGSVLALLAAMLRARDLPSSAELVALFAATVASTAQVVSHCLVWSLQRPYAAGLREARDQPAPPAAMAGYSARLALFTTVSGLTFSGLARLDAIGTMVAFALAIVLLAGRRTASVRRRWEDPLVRTRVVATVAGARA
jgi:hypothetical protein